jgi:hypothetical protein
MSFNCLFNVSTSTRNHFSISGTPGIGKSLFFVYILYRLVDDFHKKTLSWKPNRFVYQINSSYKCFDLQQQIVTKITRLHALKLVRQKDTFYVIDGQKSVPLYSCCIVMFISSPHSEWYKEFVKQKMAIKWFFPVWTLAELQTCQRHCYPDLPIEMLPERYRICAGVAHFAFYENYSIPMPFEMQICFEGHSCCLRGQICRRGNKHLSIISYAAANIGGR